MRVLEHPILGDVDLSDMVSVTVDGKEIKARRGAPIAAELLANGIVVLRRTAKLRQSRSVFCCIGRCTDCVMTVNGHPNVRSCVTPIEPGMVIETHDGLGKVGARTPCP